MLDRKGRYSAGQSSTGAGPSTNAEHSSPDTRSQTKLLTCCLFGIYWFCTKLLVWTYEHCPSVCPRPTASQPRGNSHYYTLQLSQQKQPQPEIRFSLLVRTFVPSRALMQVIALAYSIACRLDRRFQASSAVAGARSTGCSCMLACQHV